MQIQFGGLIFNGSENPYATYTVDRDGVQGLFGGVRMRREMVDRSLAHGSFSLSGFREARILEFEGKVFTRSLFEQQKALTALAGVMASGGYSTLTVSTESDTRWIRAGVHDSEEPRILVPGKVAEYKFTVIAPNPRMYGDLRTFTDGRVWHRGNFPARPVLQVSGSSSGGWTVTGPSGRQIVVTRALTSGSPHRIDLGNGGLFVGGSRVTGGVVTFQPWEIAPATTVSHTVSGGLNLSVEVRDTYM